LLFGVGVAKAVRWSQRQRTTGIAAARPTDGVRRAVLAGERDWLLARIAEQRDLTLRAIRAELADRGVKVSYDAVWRFYLREASPSKKACSPSSRTGRTWPANGTAGNVTRRDLIRAAWCSSTRLGPRPT
jgi:transposase